MLSLVIIAAGLIGAVTIAKGMDLSIEITPEEAAESLLELHSFCDWILLYAMRAYFYQRHFKYRIYVSQSRWKWLNHTIER